jgi:hypothetical protein
MRLKQDKNKIIKMEISSDFNGIKQVENKIKHGEIIGAVMGVALFAISMYAFALSIKVNKLSLRQLKDEGYE